MGVAVGHDYLIDRSRRRHHFVVVVVVALRSFTGRLQLTMVLLFVEPCQPVGCLIAPDDDVVIFVVVVVAPDDDVVILLLLSLLIALPSFTGHLQLPMVFVALLLIAVV